MHVILWSYEVAAGREAEFEDAYGPDGAWVELFRRSPGFVGTRLLRDAQTARRYVTIDEWQSATDHERFMTAARAEYEPLDDRCAAMTTEEIRLGAFEEHG